jgi:hypothetical protein
MNKLLGVKLKYSSPAATPKNIHLDWIYTLNFGSKGYYIDDGNLAQYISLEKIKMMFKPIDTTWDELAKEDEVVIVKEINKVSGKRRGL